jgi:peroxiredoxin
MRLNLILLLGAVFAAQADDLKMDWQSSGIYNKLNYYQPVHLTLSPAKPDGLKTVPADLAAPLYGRLQLGPAEAPTTFFVIVDEPEGKPSRLFVDSNANGDLTDDPPAEWKARNVKTSDGRMLTNYSGGADLQLPYVSEKVSLHLGIYRFDPHDLSRPDYVNYLFYYRDYGRVGEVAVGGKTYKAVLVDDAVTGDFRPASGDTKSSVKLLLDLNDNGKFDLRAGSFDVGQPFKIGGATYEVAGLGASGRTFQIVKSSKTVAPEEPAHVPRPPRPRLEAGANAPSFEAMTTDGGTIHFPQSYKGKLVMLDFWATWCPPCRAEIPHVAAAYAQYHAKGFEILGVSLDRPNASEKLAQFTKENQMAWPEIYSPDGHSAVAQTYSIDSIPHAFLVDGDTGKIVAEGDAIRGDNLAPAIEKALAKRP